MIFAGVHVGSMSAEAVLLTDDRVLATSIIVVKPNPVESATVVVDFVMDDRCAAGTGGFLEGIAKTFGVYVSDLGPMTLKERCCKCVNGRDRARAASRQ